MIQTGLEKLVSYGLLTDSLSVRDWANGIADIEDFCLVEGFRKAKDFKGYMTLGEFRSLCKKPVNHASHKPFKAIPHKAASKEFAKANLAKLREDLKL